MGVDKFKWLNMIRWKLLPIVYPANIICSIPDDLRNELDEWEKGNLKRIILQGVDKGEFEVIGDTEVLLDVFIMVLKGLEIPFYLQNKYERYSPHFESLMGILTKGLSP